METGYSSFISEKQKYTFFVRNVLAFIVSVRVHSSKNCEEETSLKLRKVVKKKKKILKMSIQIAFRLYHNTCTAVLAVASVHIGKNVMYILHIWAPSDTAKSQPV